MQKKVIMIIIMVSTKTTTKASDDSYNGYGVNQLEVPASSAKCLNQTSPQDLAGHGLFINTYIQNMHTECQVCDKSFLGKKQLKSHMIQYTETMPSVWNSQQDLAGHDLQTKTKDRYTKCQACDKGFVG